MSTGVAIVIGAALLLLVVTTATFIGWHRFVRKSIVSLVARSEALAGVRDAMIAVMARLGSASDEQIEEFATDPEHHERLIFHEVAAQSAILRSELDSMALPRHLVPIAEDLADSASLLAQGARCVSEATDEDSALSALAELDPESAIRYQRQGILLLRSEVQKRGIQDPSVYGGGLYL